MNYPDIPEGYSKNELIFHVPKYFFVKQGECQLRNSLPILYRVFFILTFAFSLFACQEEKTPPNEVGSKPSTESDQLPSAPPNPASTSPLLIGEVVAIDDLKYRIQDEEGQTFEIEATSMTMIDETLQSGDRAEVRFFRGTQPTAIRKIQ